jgi:hypothetical protein
MWPTDLNMVSVFNKITDAVLPGKTSLHGRLGANRLVQISLAIWHFEECRNPFYYVDHISIK